MIVANRPVKEEEKPFATLWLVYIGIISHMEKFQSVSIKQLLT